MDELLNNEEIQRELVEMDVIGDLLDKAIEFGLEVEVIYWALKYMKENPTISPVDAFVLGVTEWIK